MDDPMFDEHGYPLKDTLDEIALWPKERGWGELMRFVAKAWKSWDRNSDDGGSLVSATFTDGSELWQAAPLGWSGNEDIITALKWNRAFWDECLTALPNPTHRSPYYEFRMEPPIAPCGDHRDCETCLNRDDCMTAAEEAYDG